MKSELIVLLFISMAFSTAKAGVYLNSNLWPMHSLTACFGEKEDTPRFTENGRKLRIQKWKLEEQESIRAWITEAYNFESTGIYFTGWRDCAETVDPDVIIFIHSRPLIDFFSGFSGTVNKVGYHPGLVEGYPSAGNFVALARKISKGVAIHEFGHILGLAHEHNHPDAEVDCEFNSPFKERHELLSYTEYDPDSVMSYCNLWSPQPGLSDADSNLLKFLYPDR